MHVHVPQLVLHTVSVRHVIPAHNTHHRGARIVGQDSGNALCHGPIPNLLAFDETSELRVGLSALLATDAVQLVLLEYRSQLRQIGGTGWRRGGTPSRCPSSMLSKPFKPTSRIRLISTLSATIGSRCGRAKWNSGM
jgi:hypothetical protein